MGQILIIQESREVGAMLSGESVQIMGPEQMKGELAEARFDAAIMDASAADHTRDIMLLITEKDPDLAVVWLASGQMQSNIGLEPVAWEVLGRPFSPEALRQAVERARRHTRVLRENRALRNGAGPHAGEAAGDGNGVALHWIDHLPPRLDLRGLLSSVEKGVIQRTLTATRGAQAEAARRLGLSRSDLSYKLTKYELRRPAEPVA